MSHRYFSVLVVEMVRDEVHGLKGLKQFRRVLVHHRWTRMSPEILVVWRNLSAVWSVLPLTAQRGRVGQKFAYFRPVLCPNASSLELLLRRPLHADYLWKSLHKHPLYPWRHFMRGRWAKVNTKCVNCQEYGHSHYYHCEHQILPY